MLSKDKKYLVIQPLGGMGNRLASVLSAHELAIRDDRELLVHWTIRDGDPRNRFGAPFESLYEVDGIQLITDAEYVQYSKKARKLNLRNATRTLKPGYQEQVVSTQIHGRVLSGGERYQEWSDLFKEKYRLHPQLHQVVEAFKKKNFKGKVIGLQVRIHGHARTSQWNPTQKFLMFVERKIKEHKGKVKFFVSTDNLKTTRGFTNKFKNYVVSIEKTTELNTLRALRHTVMDCHLLQACDEFYASRHSGLSCYIAILRNEKRKYPDE